MLAAATGHALPLAPTDRIPWPRPLDVAACDALAPFEAGRDLAAAGRLEAAIAATTAALDCAERMFGPAHANTGFILDDLAVEHLRLQRLDQALAFGERAVAIMGAARPATADYAKLATNLASVHAAQGRYQEAEPLYRDAYDIFRSRTPADLALQASSARNLAVTQAELSRHEASRVLFDEAARLVEQDQGGGSAAYGRALLDLAGAHLMLNQAEQASRLAERAKALIEPDGPAELILARAAIIRSSLTEADALLEGIASRAPADQVLKGSALYNLAFVQILRGRFVEAETILKETLAAYRAVVGQRHPAIGRTLHSLAMVESRLGQEDLADQFYRQAIDIFRELFGPDDPTLAATKVEHAHLLQERGDLPAARAEIEEALRIYGAAPTARQVYKGYAYATLGFILHRQGDLAGAADAFARGLALIEDARGPNSSDLPPGLIELGLIRTSQGDFGAAEPLLEQAVAIREKDAALTPFGLSKALAALGRLRKAEGRDQDALAVTARGVDIIRDRLGRRERSFAAASHGETISERAIFEQYLEIAYDRQAAGAEATVAAMFEVAQFPNLTDTAAAVGRMAARLARGGDDLGRMMRERQDAIESWRARDYQLTDILAAGGGAEREQALGAELRTLDQEIHDLDLRLAAAFPDYAALADPSPVPVRAIQALLEPKEAVLVQVTGERLTHLLLVRADGTEVARSDLGRAELQRRVDAIRAGVDVGEQGLRSLRPFDVDSAHVLHQKLFAPLSRPLAGIDHLMVVPDGAMQNLPPALLLRSPAPAPADAYGRFRERPTEQAFEPFKDLDYLGRHLAMSVLPSVGALKALRQGFRAPSRRQPFIGFGNPAFEGDPSSNRLVSLDDLPMTADMATRRAASRRLPPLPDSERELRELAAVLEAGSGAVHLGMDASETSVKHADLAAYETVAFATHAVVPDANRDHGAEPALILPVADALGAEDDGILTESEIARLELNADWVLLSACNTAAPSGRPGAEALSGLARAFFLAGSRSLLVTHWPVDSAAATALTTGTMRAFKRAPGRGRAAALRQAMTALIDDPRITHYSHPAFWAAFAIVGEGRVQ